jgi:stearoyl-CoA desaturase (delta-9 desaturase)
VAVSPFPQPVVVAPARGVIAGRPALKKKIDNTFLIGIPLAGSVGCVFWFHSHPIHVVEFVTFLLGYFVIGMGTGIGFHRLFSEYSFVW